MEKRISAVQARRGFGQLLEEVFYRGDQVLVERAGRIMAVVVSPEVYQQWKKQRDEDFSIFHGLQERNADADPEEVERDIREGIAEARKKGRQAKR